ncbi:MAG: cyclase dehydrase [Methylobacteriaceae bacterium]|nr:cyclase dehydrase [Methylobacteriaceae bacterium]
MNRPSRRDSRTPNERLARGLGWFSIALGIAELAMPRAITRAVGLRGQERLVQGYGAREIATGVAILMSHDPTPWIYGRIGGDVLDLATLAQGLGEDNPDRDGAVAAMLAVAGVTALDMVCAGGLTAQKHVSETPSVNYSDRSGFPRGLEASRGAARSFEVPRDFRTPAPLRPYASAGMA